MSRCREKGWWRVKAATLIAERVAAAPPLGFDAGSPLPGSATGAFSRDGGRLTGKSNALGDRCVSDESDYGAHSVPGGGHRTSAPLTGHAFVAETAASKPSADMATITDRR